ncbi:MAG: hypothetical protein R3C01_10565 [Planctomycetaceae bacterium]
MSSDKHAIKTALAEKYERLANITKSTPRRKQFAFKALRYRRQAQQVLNEQR